MNESELLAWSVETGHPLPLPLADIIQLEAAGHVVDLMTGEVLFNCADVRIEPTVIAEAWCVVTGMEVAQ